MKRDNYFILKCISKLERVNHRIISLEIVYMHKRLGQALNNFAGCLMVCYRMVTLKLHSIASHCLRHLNFLKHCTVIQLCSCTDTGKPDLVLFKTGSNKSQPFWYTTVYAQGMDLLQLSNWHHCLQWPDLNLFEIFSANLNFVFK